MARIIIIGSNGQLGTDICKAFAGDEVIPLTHEDIEVTSMESCLYALTPHAPDVVINTAAYHNVEMCEKYPDSAFQVNALGPLNLAMTSKEIGSQLVHVSTDYIFDGHMKRPYLEEDCPRPLNTYGNTKLSGEYYIKSTMSEYYIVRTSALYGETFCSGKNAPNFVDRMVELSKTKDKLRVVDDEIVSPTYTKCLAEQIAKIVSHGWFGVYHATSQGSCSWYEFTRYIFDQMGISTPVERASPGEFPAKVQRPAYSVLDNLNLRKVMIDIMPDWKVSIREYIHRKYDG